MGGPPIQSGLCVMAVSRDFLQPLFRVFRSGCFSVYFSLDSDHRALRRVEFLGLLPDAGAKLVLDGSFQFRPLGGAYSARSAQYFVVGHWPSSVEPSDHVINRGYHVALHQKVPCLLRFWMLSKYPKERSRRKFCSATFIVKKRKPTEHEPHPQREEQNQTQLFVFL